VLIPYGRGWLKVDVEGEVVSELGVSPKPGAVRDALVDPVSSPRLSEIAGRHVAVLVSDITRPVPTSQILPSLLRELEGREVSIIFALGLHRRQTRAEQARILGSTWGYRCLEHDLEDCLRVGVTGRGTPVEIFRPVVEADTVVCTGGIEYHYYAGYTGGCKALLPGVASRESIHCNHSLMWDPSCRPGNPGSLVRLDLEEAGRIAGVDFILNTVSDSRGRIIGAVAGHPVKAHRRGAEILDGFCRLKIEKADVLLVSPGGWPFDINLYQAHKALENTKRAVKKGGSIILVAECCEGLGNQVFQDWLNRGGSNRGKDDIKRGFVMGGHKAVLLAELARDYRLHLVSNLKLKILERYFTLHQTVQGALETALAEQGGGRVVVVREGSHLLLG